MYQVASSGSGASRVNYENECPWDEREYTAAENDHNRDIMYEFECIISRRIADSEDMISQRITELEDMYSQRITELEDMFSQRMAELDYLHHLDCLRYASSGGGASRLAHENDYPQIPKFQKFDVSFDTTPTNPDVKDEEICCICKTNSIRVQHKPCDHLFCASCTNTLIDKYANRVLTCQYCRAKVESMTELIKI